MRAERGPSQAIDDVPRVPVLGGSGFEAFRMGESPLELPLAAVVGFDGGLVGRNQDWRVVLVVVAEKVAAADILDLEPAVWKGGDRENKFPEVLAAVGGIFLDVDPGTGAWLVAVDIEYLVVHDVDDSVRDHTDIATE